MLESFKHLVSKKTKEEDQIETYKRELAQHPENVDHRLRLADLYAKTEDKVSAIQEYTTAALQYANDGYLVKAIAVNKIIVRLDPAREEALERLSDLYFQRGTPADELVQEYRKAKEKEQEPKEQPEIQVESGEPPALDIQPPEGIGSPEILIDLTEEYDEKLDATLARVSLFSFIDPIERQKIAEFLTPLTFEKDATIITEGEMGDSMYIIQSGQVGVYTTLLESTGVSVIKTDQERLHLATLKEGDFFGEQALITKEPRSATIIALTEANLLKFSKQDLTNVVKLYPRIGDVLKKAHQQRISNTMEALKSIW